MLSIVSWVLCPVIPAVVALVLASKAEKEIDSAPDRVSGRGLILPTRIISWINIGLYAAIIVIGGVFVLIAALLSNA